MGSWGKTLAIAGVCAAIASGSSAAVVTLDSVVGVWQNTLLSNGAAANNEGTSEITWGSDLGDGLSGYEFNAVTGLPSVVGSPFDLGEFVHNNFPIGAPSLESADLSVSITGNIDGLAFALNPVFSFTHFETTNFPSGSCAAGGVEPCPDLVTLVNSQDLTEVVNTPDGPLTLTILGFDTGSGPFSSFLTLEDESNFATLRAEFLAPIPGTTVVPLPAAGWMLLAGVGGLAAFGRRRNKSL
ncbi:MAG: THxN family PEP-CTERM protein [Pseudomonadota bacterium]